VPTNVRPDAPRRWLNADRWETTARWLVDDHAEADLPATSNVTDRNNNRAVELPPGDAPHGGRIIHDEPEGKVFAITLAPGE
jgi:hypothetical protein